MNLKEKESVYTSSRDGNLQYLKVRHAQNLYLPKENSKKNSTRQNI